MAKKKKNPITPVAPCLYPFLKKPDTRWKKEGEYKVSLVFDQDDDFVAKVEKKAKKEFALKKKDMKPADAKKVEFVSPVKVEVDENDKETGNVILGFKSNAQFTDKKTDEVVKVKMKIFDAQGKAIEDIPNIGNGSKLSVAFKAIGSVIKDRKGNIDFYLSLWMNAVQLVELIEYNPDGSSYGFGKEEGGYEHDEVEGSDFSDQTSDVAEEEEDDSDF